MSTDTRPSDPAVVRARLVASMKRLAALVADTDPELGAAVERLDRLADVGPWDAAVAGTAGRTAIAAQHAAAACIQHAALRGDWMRSARVAALVDDLASYLSALGR